VDTRVVVGNNIIFAVNVLYSDTKVWRKHKQMTVQMGQGTSLLTLEACNTLGPWFGWCIVGE